MKRRTHKPESLERRSYRQMRRRCLSEKSHAWEHYGGRGIRICERWLGEGGFAAFVEDMGPRPSAKHSIDRIDPDGNYEPPNCRWATSAEQALTKRNNRHVEVRGRRMTLKEWTDETGFPPSLIQQRLDSGWDPERAVTELPRNVPERPTRAKISHADVLEILARLANGEKQNDIAQRFGVTQSAVSHIKHGRRWPGRSAA